VAKVEASHTGRFLREVLARRPLKPRRQAAE
jgi:excinuclease ABC subunit A